MASEDTVLCVLTAGILFFALRGLPAGAFSRIPLIGRLFPSPHVQKQGGERCGGLLLRVCDGVRTEREIEKWEVYDCCVVILEDEAFFFLSCVPVVSRSSPSIGAVWSEREACRRSARI
jgi:hypothetical protein